MIPRPLIRAICAAYPRHVICFRQAMDTHICVVGANSFACGEEEKDAIITGAAAKGMPVLIVEAINENTPAK